MKNFKERLSLNGVGVLNERAEVIFEMASLEEDQYITSLKTKVARIKAAINKHDDLSIKNADSLTPAEDFEAKDWINKRHELERELYNANLELQVALDVHNKEFGESTK